MSLFVYGTLLLPEIRDALLGKVINHTPGELSGYAAHTHYKANYESEYPILKREKDSILSGCVLQGLTTNDYNILKFYEGDEYCLNEIEVSVDGQIIRTNIFTNKNDQAFRYCKKWDLEIFVKNHLQYYLNKIIPELLIEISK